MAEDQSPTIITAYQHKPLTRKDEIRLLHLRPGEFQDPLSIFIDHATLPDCSCLWQLEKSGECSKCHDLAGAPEFEALSYTWGDLFHGETVLCQSLDDPGWTSPMRVTTNCASALRALRDAKRPRTLWIDAICIDQSNLSERSAQVKIMQRMYKTATQVVVYLGESNHRVERAINIMEDEAQGLNREVTDDLSESDIASIRELVSRPWFRRVWVLQEVASARSAVVMCGQRTTAWDRTFHENMELWLGHHERLRPFPHVMGFGPSWLARSNFSAIAFFEQLCKARGCDATEPHDKVYAILSLFRNIPFDDRLIVDYSRSSATVFAAIAGYLICSVGPMLLGQVFAGNYVEDLPSWAPDWTVSRFRMPCPLHKMYRSYWDLGKRTETCNMASRRVISASSLAGTKSKSRPSGPLLFSTLILGGPDPTSGNGKRLLPHG